METLNKIPAVGMWPDIAQVVNENFTKVGIEFIKVSENLSLYIPLCRSISEAETFILNPSLGQMILVGRTLPADVYKWDGATWSYTGGRAGGPTINLAAYPTIQSMNAELASRDARIAELERKVNELATSVGI